LIPFIRIYPFLEADWFVPHLFLSSYLKTFETTFYSIYSKVTLTGRRIMARGELLDLCQSQNFNNTQGQLPVTPIEMVLTISKMMSSGEYYLSDKSNRLDRAKIIENYKLLKGKEAHQNNVLPVAELFSKLPKAREALELIFTQYVPGETVLPKDSIEPPELSLTKEFYTLPKALQSNQALSDEDLAEAIGQRFKPIIKADQTWLQKEESLLFHFAKKAHWRKEVILGLFRTFPKLDDKVPPKDQKASELDKWQAMEQFIKEGKFDKNFTGNPNPSNDKTIALVMKSVAPLSILPSAWLDSKQQDALAAQHDAAVEAREKSNPALKHGLIDLEAKEGGPPEASDLDDVDDDISQSAHKNKDKDKFKKGAVAKSPKKSGSNSLQVFLDVVGITLGVNSTKYSNAGAYSSRLHFSSAPSC